MSTFTDEANPACTYCPIGCCSSGLFEMSSIVCIVDHVDQASAQIGVVYSAVFQFCLEAPVNAEECGVEMAYIDVRT